MSGRWLRATGADGHQHIVYLPEQRRHTLRTSCPCGPAIAEYGRAFVVTHQALTRASLPPMKREREH